MYSFLKFSRRFCPVLFRCRSTLWFVSCSSFLLLFSASVCIWPRERGRCLRSYGHAYNNKPRRKRSKPSKRNERRQYDLKKDSKEFSKRKRTNEKVEREGTTLCIRREPATTTSSSVYWASWLCRLVASLADMTFSRLAPFTDRRIGAQSVVRKKIIIIIIVKAYSFLIPAVLWSRTLSSSSTSGRRYGARADAELSRTIQSFPSRAASALRLHPLVSAHTALDHRHYCGTD